MEGNQPSGNSIDTNLLEIVCLCGSTRFSDVFQQASLRETMNGHMVLSIGIDTKADTEAFKGFSEKDAQLIKHYLDVVHFHKIILCNRILVLNVGGYIGESTTREILFAISLGKEISWWEPDNVPEAFRGGYYSPGPQPNGFDYFINHLAMQYARAKQ